MDTYKPLKGKRFLARAAKSMTMAFLFLPAILVLFSGPMMADVKLPSVISDNMVLQRNSKVKVWGWASPGEKIRIRASWLKSAVSVTADDSGRWITLLKTIKEGGPYTLTITGGNVLKVKNILLGEVWVCSGQSNMEFTIDMLGGWDAFYHKEEQELEKNDFSRIRLCQVQKATVEVPADTCTASWSPANVKNVTNFSATAYFFGRELYRKLHLPIGLISSNWGGTPAEAWTERQYLETDPDLKYYLQAPNSNGWVPGRPSVLFNGMIHPILNYAIRGVIWYQGEANRNDADTYGRLFATMIRNWREAWGLGDFPFYYVQIAPYKYDEPFPCAAYLREAQLKTLSVANTGMAVTMDIGDIGNIHPKNKQEVSRRLALWALAKTYGKKVPDFSGPVFKEMKKEENKIRLFFDHAEGGLVTRDGKLTCFTVAGTDGKFVDADATIDGNTVVVSGGGAVDPVAVRFAFTNTDSSTLFNKVGLPSSSFRTDSLPFLARNVHIGIMWKDSSMVPLATMTCPDSLIQIRYTLDGSEPSFQSSLFSGGVQLLQSTKIKARAFKGQTPSLLMAEASYLKHLGVGKKIAIVNKCSERYTGGENALLDGLRGSLNFRDGHWQGYQGVDFDGVIDLGDTVEIHHLAAGFLQNNPSWIFLPSNLAFSVSIDGVAFTKVSEIQNDESPKREDAFVKLFETTCSNVKARYVKVHAASIGVCPDWHPGKGDKAWMFMDEIVVE
ncbi:MAG: sialate O-acetylesterase [Bacteroidota bacterium]